MRKARTVLLAIAVLVTLAACEEGEDAIVPQPVSGTISGTVTADGVGLPGVTVAITDGRTATTDAAGRYSFSDIPHRTNIITISGFPPDVVFNTTTRAEIIATTGQTVISDFPGQRVRATSTPAPTPTATQAAAAPRVATRTGTDHPPFARTYPRTGASVLLACITGDFPAGTVFTIRMQGNGSDGEHSGAATSPGTVEIVVPIFSYGPYTWTITSARFPDGRTVQVEGTATGQVGPSESPGCA